MNHDTVLNVNQACVFLHESQIYVGFLFGRGYTQNSDSCRDTMGSFLCEGGQFFCFSISGVAACSVQNFDRIIRATSRDGLEGGENRAGSHPEIQNAPSSVHGCFGHLGTWCVLTCFSQL